LERITSRGFNYIPVDYSYIHKGNEIKYIHPHPWPIRCVDVGHSPRSILTTCGDCIYRCDLRENDRLSKITRIHSDPYPNET
jgi:hypothetical protein